MYSVFLEYQQVKPAFFPPSLVMYKHCMLWSEILEVPLGNQSLQAKTHRWVAIQLTSDSPGDLPDPGRETVSPVSPALPADSLLLEPLGKRSEIRFRVFSTLAPLTLLDGSFLAVRLPMLCRKFNSIPGSLSSRYQFTYPPVTIVMTKYACVDVTKCSGAESLLMDWRTVDVNY